MSFVSCVLPTFLRLGAISFFLVILALEYGTICKSLGEVAQIPEIVLLLLGGIFTIFSSWRWLWFLLRIYGLLEMGWFSDMRGLLLRPGEAN